MFAGNQIQQLRVGNLRPGFILLLCWLSVCMFATEYPLQFKTANLALYADKKPSPQIQQTLFALDSRIDELQMQLGVYLDELAPIYLMESEKTYNELALGKAQIVEFSDAFYDGKQQCIYLRPLTVQRSDYPGILLHEYLHWYLEKLFLRAPLWFHEGMAMHFSGQMGFDKYLIFLQQSFIGRSSDLFRLSSHYPENRDDWQIFYLSSSMAIRYMSDRHAESWKRFWELVAYAHRKGEKAEFSSYFALAYNTNLYDFHLGFSAWAHKLRWQYLIWGLNAMLALLLPLIVVLGYRNRQKRRAALPDLPEPEDAE